MKKTAVLAAAVLLLALAAWAQKPSPAIPQASNQAATAREATASPAVTSAHSPSPERPLALPAGTTVQMKLESTISTSYNKAGDPFAGRVIAPVVLEGTTVIPVGASIAGRVIKVSEVRRYRGRPLIDLHPQTIIMPNGQRYEISAVVSAADSSTGTSVNREGEIRGSGIDGRDKMEMAVGAGAGMGIGAAFGGAKGALIGSAVGATATAVRWLSKTKSADLPPGSEITIELSRPVMLSASRSRQ
jgi:hypothetical protein